MKKLSQYLIKLFFLIYSGFSAVIRKHRLFLLCFLVCLLYISPQFYFQYPNFLDLAETFAYGANIKNGWEMICNQYTRFTPLFIVYRLFVNAVFRYHVQGYFFAHCVLLALTIYGMIRYLQTQRVTWYIIAIIVVFFLSFSNTIDTFWRLGTLEQFVGLLLVWLLYFAAKGKTTALMWLSILMLLTKETGVFFAPLSVFVLIREKKYVLGSILASIYFIVVWYISFVILPVASPINYLKHVSFYGSNILEMAKHYISSYPMVSFLYIFSYILLLLKNKHFPSRLPSNITLLFMLPPVSFCSILFFYNPNQPYYLYPTVVCVVLLFACALSHYQAKIQMVSIAVSVFFWLCFGVRQTFIDRMVYWQQWYAGDGVVIEAIQQKYKEGTIHFATDQDWFDGGMKWFIGDRYVFPQDPATYTLIEVSTLDKLSETDRVFCGNGLFIKNYCHWVIRNNIQN